MTERLYYTDSYLTRFHARVVDRSPDGRRVYLDRTAFYPSSGGQPFDTGALGDSRVVEVIDEGERIAHLVEPAVSFSEAEARLDWPRRFDFMQQHSGQHLLSAVCAGSFGFRTVAVHLGEEISTIEIETPALSPEQVRQLEIRANQVVCENRPLSVSFEEASEAAALRAPSKRQGLLRIVTIHDLDRSACGGTHVRATGEIGPISIRRQEKIRNNARLEFLCGLRAVHRFRADYDALARAADLLSSTLEDVPRLAAAQAEAARSADKARRKLEAELAACQGRDLYAATSPNPAGLRRALRRLKSGPLDPLRGMAQGFCAGPRAVFIGAVDEPPSLLLASSEDSGVDCGLTLKAAVAASGGRGGGSARIAQASAGSLQSLDALLARLYDDQ